MTLRSLSEIDQLQVSGLKTKPDLSATSTPAWVNKSDDYCTMAFILIDGDGKRGDE